MEISKNEMSEFKEGGDLIVYKKDSTIYSFEDSTYHISNDSLYGKGSVKFSEYSYFKVEIENAIPLTNIEKIQQDELNPTNTTWLIIGGILWTASVGFLIVMGEAMSGI